MHDRGLLAQSTALDMVGGTPITELLAEHSARVMTCKAKHSAWPVCGCVVSGVH